ncbi:hypothetical protein F5H01DRAFT_404478 [Linnemannia elongata]|nr:hypothetical protein F5H01DRAFT_404478 [Linnemannia elongata]
MNSISARESASSARPSFPTGLQGGASVQRGTARAWVVVVVVTRIDADARQHYYLLPTLVAASKKVEELQGKRDHEDGALSQTSSTSESASGSTVSNSTSGVDSFGIISAGELMTKTVSAITKAEDDEDLDLLNADSIESLSRLHCYDANMSGSDHMVPLEAVGYDDLAQATQDQRWATKRAVDEYQEKGSRTKMPMP